MRLVASPHDARPRPLPEADDLRLRAAASARADQLAVDIQDGANVTAAEIADFVHEADHRGWSEVARTGLLLEVLRSEREPDEVHIAAIERLLDRATGDGDAAAASNALARRSEVLAMAGDPALLVAANADLARATVLLEGTAGSPRMRARAHISCGVA